MRIIEPHQLKQQAPSRKSERSRWILLSVLVIASIAVWQVSLMDSRRLRLPAIAQTQEKNQVEVVEKDEKPKPRQLKKFTNEQFRDLYNAIAFPNTAEIVDAPVISGNATADRRIRRIAFSRGYKLRSAPVAPLSSTEDGFALQQKAVKPWHDMKRAAARDGIPLGLASAYRSIDEQRLIFLQSLKATGATINEVAAGLADKRVERVLTKSSIPGTSRHHSGYAVDLKCSNEEFTLFVYSKCFEWLSKNNYENAKRYGWIPSYPPGTPNQGPEPEAWEYVWVGTDALFEK